MKTNAPNTKVVSDANEQHAIQDPTESDCGLHSSQIQRADNAPPKARGRPKSNIFNVYRAKVGEPPTSAPLQYHRMRAMTEHKTWVAKFAPKGKLKSESRRRFGDDNWWQHKEIEIAMIVRGMKCPQRYDKRPYKLDRYWPYQDEAYLFRRFVYRKIHEVQANRRGPKLDPEKVYRTGLAAEVARKLVQPKGGNWRTLATPTQVAQVHYVIFGEEESADNIKKRFWLVGRICHRFSLEGFSSRQSFVFEKLGRALREKYEPQERSGIKK